MAERGRRRRRRCARRTWRSRTSSRTACPQAARTTSSLLDTVGTPPEVADPRDHVEIGAALGAIDTDRGAKVSGARFYFLTGIGAKLEFALVNLAMAQADAAGFTPVIAPGTRPSRDHGGHRLPRRARS